MTLIEIKLTAQGNIFAERAFDEFHYYISSARDEIIKNFNTGLLFDIHGHGANPMVLLI